MVTGGRGANSCRSDGRAIAGGICVDTGTHERVANWSPDSFATVDPCDPCSAFDATAKRLTQCWSTNA